MESIVLFNCCFYALPDASIKTEPEAVLNMTSATLSCNLTNPSSPIKGHYWTRNDKMIEKSDSSSGSTYIEYQYVPQPYVNNFLKKKKRAKSITLPFW